jgi:hypothetical protein
MSNVLILYIAIAPFAWAFNCCVSYAYLQRKYPSNAREQRTLNTVFSLLFALLTATVWPVLLPVTYLATERYRFGFAIPGSHPPGEDSSS